ncbi:MAG: Uma2 family endonuclease [Acidobacteria bacterium]|nr:Uma2 family endonuclease [Acidobacteriota bacterium]
MATTVQRMSVEEFLALPAHETEGCELHYGEIVYMAPPKHLHWLTREALLRALRPVAEPLGLIGAEMGFQCGDDDIREADIGFVTHDRARGISVDGYLAGAPDMVVEILSASNSRAEMLEREMRCLMFGCREFWTVDPAKQTVRAATSKAILTYGTGDDLVSSLFPGWSVPVAQLFS